MAITFFFLRKHVFAEKLLRAPMTSDPVLTFLRETPLSTSHQSSSQTVHPVTRLAAHICLMLIDSGAVGPSPRLYVCVCARTHVGWWGEEEKGEEKPREEFGRTFMKRRDRK